MNRDERRTRPPALPPTRVVRQGVPLLLPVDGEAGGTWISVNALGHTLALLNRYEDSPHDSDGPFISRGLLVLELAGSEGSQAVDRALPGFPLSSYRPFTLASISETGAPWLFEWDGRVLERSRVTTPGLVRASSGSDQQAAERARGTLFREAAAGPRGLNLEVLAALHRSHRPEKGPLSVCMHREEAVTVSCSLITVSTKSVSFLYIAGSPCESQERIEASLPR